MSTKHTGNPLAITEVSIDQHCTGSRWEAADIDLLARLVAIIAMGQAAHAASIINALASGSPAFNHKDLRARARQSLTVTGSTDEQRDARRHHRDGLIFEAISWGAARQENSKALLRDPHISSTTQGLDGLMIEKSGSEITRTTIFEDKCSNNPRDKFRDEIMPAFQAHHRNERATELLATAAALLQQAGLDGTKAVKAADRVLDKEYRAYRASLTVTSNHDSDARRKSLFKGYESLDEINAGQRLGAVLITADNLRDWFDDLANRAIAYINSLDEEAA